MLDTYAYTSERVAPITGPRPPKGHKRKKAKFARGGRISEPASGGARIDFPPGSAIMVSPRILDELRAIAPSMLNPGRFDRMSGIADPYFSGYPIVASRSLA